MTEEYYGSDRFQNILWKYENWKEGGIGELLDAEELTDIAEFYYNTGRHEEAMETADLAMHIYPGATAPLAFKARMVILLECDRDKAEKIANQIADKSDIEYVYTMAEIMVADNQPEEADEYLRAYMEDTHEEIESDTIQDFIIDVAYIFSDYELYDLCEEWLKMCVQKNTEAYKELQGRIMMSRGMYEESEKLFNELIDSNPYSGEYWNQLASSQLMHNKIREAITSSEYSIAINPDDDEAIINKANGLFSLGNYKEALEYYKKYTSLNPDSELGEMFQGTTLAYLDQIQEAVIHLKKAEKNALREIKQAGTTHGPWNESPNLIQIYQELAFLESRLGHSRKAMDYLDKMEEMGEDVCMADVIRGYIQLEKGDTEMAQSFFTKAIRTSHASPEVMLHIAIAVYDNGYVKIAYRLFHMFLYSTPLDWSDGFAYLARCCFDLGKSEEFKNVLQVAVRINPVEARAVLADLYPEGTTPDEYPGIEPVHPKN